MSYYEPVAKRTRLSVSHSQSQSSPGEKSELRMLNDTIKSKCDEVFQSVAKMNELINTMKEHANKPGIDCQLREMESILKEIENRMKSATNRLNKTEQNIDLLSIPLLHTYDCDQSEGYLMKMKMALFIDPLCLERRREVLDSATSLYSTMEHKRSPLHDAVKRGHVKCVQFLLKSGANLMSLTTDDNNILYTLYYSRLDDKVRLDILKLLLKKGGARLFGHKQTDDLAFQIVNIKNGVEEASLLLQYGATVNEQVTQLAMEDAWEMYSLSLIKVYLLHCTNLVKIGPAPPSVYKQLIHRCYMQMILGDTPLDKSHDKLLEALQLYKAFGGKFLVCPNKYPNHNLLRFLKGYRHRRHFDGAVSRIKALISNPLSLKEISRLAVRKLIDKKYLENIKKLEVPVDLQPFLRFDDIIITQWHDKCEEFSDCSSGEDENVSTDDEGEEED